MKLLTPYKITTVATAVAVFLHASSTYAFVSSRGHPMPKMRFRKKTVLSASSNEDVKAEQTTLENYKTTLKQQEFKPATWNPLRLMVMKLGFTELKWTSPLNYVKKDGVFKCANCGLELFDTSGKYDSGSGWPSFWRSSKDGHVDYKMEWDGRLECRCTKCSAHLGHVFLDGPRPSSVPKEVYETAPSSDPRGRQENGSLPRFCVNGASLKFEETGDNGGN